MDRARSYSRAWYTASGYRMRLACSLESSLSKTRQSWSSCPAFRSIKNDSRVSGIHETDSVIIACPRGRISRKAMETTLSVWVTFFLLVRLTRRRGNMDEISGRSAVIPVNAAYLNSESVHVAFTKKVLRRLATNLTPVLREPPNIWILQIL